MSLPAPARDDLREMFGARLRVDEPLARHTSARIGGPADAFIAAESLDDLRGAARIAWAHDVPLFLLGAGSNILVSDGGVRGLVVHNRARSVAIVGPTVTADSGVSTIRLAKRLARNGLSGFEWAIGVPGTLGGAVYGNAGAYDGDMSACVGHVEAITPDGEVRWTNNDLGFEYRSSILKREQRPCVILSVVLAFTPAPQSEIMEKMQSFNEYRKKSQPPGATIGSMFKNPPGDYAGRLIEAAGLKGERIGGAQISEKHANFFLNVEEATAEDVRALVECAREAVMQQFGVELELEVEFIGEWE